VLSSDVKSQGVVVCGVRDDQIDHRERVEFTLFDDRLCERVGEALEPIAVHQSNHHTPSAPIVARQRRSVQPLPSTTGLTGTNRADGPA
jgi:hypothetical protein